MEDNNKRLSVFSRSFLDLVGSKNEIVCKNIDNEFHDGSSDSEENIYTNVYSRFQNLFFESDIQEYLNTGILSRLICCIVNIAILFSGPHGLQIIDNPYVWLAYFPLSFLATYRYLTCSNVYDIYNFERLYLMSSGKSKENLDKMKTGNDEMYFYTIIAYFKKKYPGMRFQRQQLIRPDSEKKDHAQDQSQIIFKANERKENPDKIDFLQVFIWHHDDNLGWYFIFLNPMFVVAALFSGMEIFLLDFIILVVISQLLQMITHDDNAMEGEGFIQLVLQAEKLIANDKEIEVKRRNGQIIHDYLTFINRKKEFKIKHNTRVQQQLQSGNGQPTVGQTPQFHLITDQNQQSGRGPTNRFTPGFSEMDDKY